ncbi:MAG TPA: glutathione synthetase [Thermoanaerobaculia bacterium]|nr:glutathione synthetase [Thermoanaerobaculia bacterium]
MRIGFFVNSLQQEHPKYTTTTLAREAVRRGHEVCYIEADGFSYLPDTGLHVQARLAPKNGDASLPAFLGAMQGPKAPCESLAVTDLDALMLRNDPAEDVGARAWAQTVGVIFGQMAARSGVLVLNDPDGLSGALNKLYFQHYPPDVRPRTLITRSAEAISEFVEEEGTAVLKPLQGSGGQSVFLVRPEDRANLNQMTEAVLRDGYVIAQEYLPAAAEGDIRLFLMNGDPLRVKGKYAAFRRIGRPGDLRSNMHAGGKAEKVDVSDDALRVAEIVRPKLIQDGMFLVGLDLAGDKLMEINVFSPGGLNSAGRLQKANFAAPVVEAVERKVASMARYGGHFSNARLATL